MIQHRFFLAISGKAAVLHINFFLVQSLFGGYRFNLLYHGLLDSASPV